MQLLYIRHMTKIQFVLYCTSTVSCKGELILLQAALLNCRDQYGAFWLPLLRFIPFFRSVFSAVAMRFEG